VNPTELGWLAAIVATAFCIEAATGFGGTVVALTLGSARFGLDPLLAVLVPLNLILSGWILSRQREHVSKEFLLRRALPGMAVGFLLGTALTGALPAGTLALGFGLFVAGVALWQLITIARPVAPLKAGPQWAALLAGGVAHGLFATGGPLAVIAAQRALPKKEAFRATLACVWLVLNLGVAARLAWNGSLGPATLLTSAVLIAPLMLGGLLGDRLHHLLGRDAFRAGVASLLLLGGGFIAWSHR
jgi:uncharacterized membrane protein YfcA